jgi:hypothetical protein
MKIALILLLAVYGLTANAQTDSLEKVFINKKIQDKTITQEEIAKLNASKWTQTLKQLGNYPDLPMDENNEVHYSFVKTYEKPQNWLFSRTMEWLMIYYGFKPNDLYYNREDGKIIFQNSVSLESPKSVVMTAVITIKTNKVRVELMNLGYQTFYPGYNSAGGWIPETTVYNPISDFYPVLGKKDSEWAKTLNLFKSTNQTLSSDVNKLWIYIGNYVSINEF